MTVSFLDRSLTNGILASNATAMRGRVNYLVFFIRIIFCLGISFLAIWGAISLVRECLTDLPEAGELGRTIVFMILIFYVAFRLGQAAWHQRFTIRLVGDQIIVKDMILFKRRTLRSNDIKGFSLMEYTMGGIRLMGWVKGKSIMLYLEDGDKIEFPEFLFMNFTKMDRALEESGLQFFGIESIEWRWKKLE